MKLGDIWLFIKAAPDALMCWAEKQKDIVERDLLTVQLLQLGFKWNLGDGPAFDVGTALQLAEEYHIELHIGTCYSQCRAVLECQYWQSGITIGVKSAQFGSFCENQPHDEIEAICAFGFDVKTAICKCLVNARIAGVI